MTLPATHPLRRVGLLAVLALVLVQLATVGHALAADHQPGEGCAVCLTADRSDEPGAPGDVTAASAAPAVGAVPDATAALPGDRPPCRHRVRDPPAL